MAKIMALKEFSIGAAKFNNVRLCRSPYTFFADATHSKVGVVLDKPRHVLFKIQVTNIIGTTNDTVQSVVIFERHSMVMFEDDE